MPVSKYSAAFAWIAFIPSSGCEVSGLKTRFISAFWSPQVANRDLAKYTYRLYRGAPTDFSQMCKTIWNWSANQLAQVFMCRLEVRYQSWYIFRFCVFQLQVCLHWCVFVFLCHCVCVFFVFVCVSFRVFVCVCLFVCMQVGGGEISEEVCKCTNANNANNGGSTSDLDHHFQAGVWGEKNWSSYGCNDNAKKYFKKLERKRLQLVFEAIRRKSVEALVLLGQELSWK